MTFSTNQTRRHFWGFIMYFSLLNYTLMASASELTTDLESNNPTKAKAAFNVAIEQANSRFKHFQDNQQAIALIQTSEDEEGNLFSQEFTPETSTQGLWQTLTEEEAFNQNIAVENSIFFNTEVLDVKNSTLINETDSTWVFQVPNVLNVDTDEALSAQDKTKMDSAIAQHLSTEVIVNKNPIRISGLKVYAKQPFKPSLMASIEIFELRVYFDEAWQDGPLIRHNFTQHIKGSYGWLYKIEDLITTNVSNIRQINLLESGTE